MTYLSHGHGMDDHNCLMETCVKGLLFRGSKRWWEVYPGPVSSFLVNRYEIISGRFSLQGSQ